MQFTIQTVSQFQVKLVAFLGISYLQTIICFPRPSIRRKRVKRSHWRQEMEVRTLNMKTFHSKDFFTEFLLIILSFGCFTWLASTVAWATLTPEELWKLIADDTEKQFGFELNWLVCMWHSWCNCFNWFSFICKVQWILINFFVILLQQKQWWSFP